jgi:hypothetical protein
VQPRLLPVRRILIRSLQDETGRSNTELTTTEENKYIKMPETFYGSVILI